MPNVLVENYRRNNPTTPLTDDEITWNFVATNGAAAVISQFPEVAADIQRIDLESRRANAGSLPAEFVRSATGGVDTAQAKLYDTVALAGDILGSETLTGFGQRGYERNIVEAEKNQPTIREIGEIGGAGDALRYLVGLGGSQAPQLAGTVAGSVAGGLVGGLAGGPAGVIPGAAIGGGLAGFSQMQNRGELMRQGAQDVIPTAVAVGGIGAILEMLVPLKVTSAILKAVPDDAAKGYFARVLRDVPINALEEGSTEVAQEITAMAGEVYANRNNPNFQLTSEDIQRRVINAGAAGAILGGALGTIQRPGTDDTTSRTTKTEQETTGGTTTAAPPVAEPVVPVPPQPAVRPADAASIAYRDAALDALLEEEGYRQMLPPEPEPDARVQMAVRGMGRVAGETPQPFWMRRREPVIYEQTTQEKNIAENLGDKPVVVPPAFGTEAALPKDGQTLGGDEINAQEERWEEELLNVNDAQAAAPRPPAQPEAVAPAVPPASVAPPVVAPPRITFNLDAVDWDNSSLKADPTAARGAVPAFVEITKNNETFSPALGQTLTADSAKTSNETSKSNTTRIGFFENQETGAVHFLPVWKTSSKQRGDVYYVGNPDKAGGMRLNALMEAGYVPVGSMRLKEPVSGTAAENKGTYEDFSEFEREALGPGRLRMQQAVSNMVAVSEGMQAQGFGEGDTLELAGLQQATSPGAKEGAIVVEEDQEDVFRQTVMEELSQSRDLSLEGIRKAVVNVGLNEPQAFLEASRQLLADPAVQKDLWDKPPEVAQGLLVLEIAQRIYDKFGSAGNIQNNPQASLGLGGPSSEAGGASLFSLPEGTVNYRATGGDIKTRFNQTQEAAVNSGVAANVDIVQAVGKEVGSFNGKTRIVTLALFDANNPSRDNLRLLLHEIGHGVSRQLTEPQRQAVYRAIEKLMPKIAERLAQSTDPRIRASNPNGLPQEVLVEEILAELLALEQLDAPASKSIAATIIRFVRDLYYRMALAVQEVFGRQPNHQLALAFVRNRFEAVTSGDRMGLFRFLIPPSASIPFEGDLFSRPGIERIGERVDPAVLTQTTIAAQNEQIDVERGVATALVSVPGAVARAQERGQTLLQWWRKVAGLPNAEALVANAMREIDPATGLPITSDLAFRITSFEAPQNRQQAARRALELVGKQWSKVSRMISELQDKIAKTEFDRQAGADQLQVLNQTPAIPLADPDEARRQAQIRELTRETQSLANLRDEMEAKLSAAQQVVGLYYQKKNELEGENKVHKPFHFGQGAEYWVPERLDATGIGDGFRLRKVNLDRDNQITKRSEVEEDIRLQTEWLDAARQRGQQDGVYFQVEAWRDELFKHKVETDYRNTDFSLMFIKLSALGEQAKAFGTPAMRLVGQMIDRFAAQARFLRPQMEELTRRAQRAKHDAWNILTTGQDWYMDNIYRITAGFLESRRDIAEKHPRSFKTQMDEAMELLKRKIMADQDKAILIKGKEEKFFAAVRKHMESEWAVAQKLLEYNAAQGIGVKDERLGAERAPINQGVLTIPRRASGLLGSVFGSMEQKNWAAAKDAWKNAAATYYQFGPDQLRAEVLPFFADENIQDNFFAALVYDVPTTSPFPAPRIDENTQPEANPAYADQAYKLSNGDPITFFEKMYDLHGGIPTDAGRAQYVEDGLLSMANIFEQMRRIREYVDPQSMARKDFGTMIPGFMIHAREVSDLPASWFDYVSFDEHTMGRITERVAGQAAFGPDQVRLQTAYNAGVKEIQREVAKLEAATATVRARETSKKESVVDAALAKELGSVAELKRLRRLKEMMNVLLADTGGIKDELITYFNGKHSPMKTVRFLQQLIGTFARLMLNQFGSALSQTAEVFTPFMAFGPTPQAIRQTFRNIGGVSADLAGGLVNALGGSLERTDRLFRRMMDLGMTDTGATKKIADVLNDPKSPFGDEPAATRILRLAGQLQNISTRGGGGFTAVRPLAPFTQSSISLHMIGTLNFIKEIQDMVARGVAYAKNQFPNGMPSELADETVSQWADRLGIKGRRKDGFVKIFQHAVDDWGLDFFSLVKDGVRSEVAGKDILSDDTLRLLQGMWIKESTSEANLSTMPAAQWTNSVIHFMSPLLGWAFRRSQQVSGLRYDEKGASSYAALAKGLTGLALVGTGGLAVSLLVDAYNEEILRKRRNLRRLDPTSQSFASFCLAILEHSARVGTFGLLGDVANEMVNVGTGEGANRGISLDQRVVFMNSTMGMARAVAAFVNQGFEADYMNVVRPAMYSFGGNGALQYLQAINGITGADNIEARAVSRTNVSNWLRIVGREIGLEVRPSRAGGYSTPTPMTPHITRMQLAAIGDDPQAFMAAYREAIAEAREQGQKDPADAVAKSFQSRHPLKSIFRVAPSEQDYRRIIAALPDGGRADVQEAVSLMNRYGARIGVEPYEGKQEKAKKAPTRDSFGFGNTFDVRSARDRAAEFSASF